jgi:hypothetical protein
MEDRPGWEAVTGHWACPLKLGRTDIYKPWLTTCWWCNNHLEKWWTSSMGFGWHPTYEMENKPSLKPPTRQSLWDDHSSIAGLAKGFYAASKKVKTCEICGMVIPRSPGIPYKWGFPWNKPSRYWGTPNLRNLPYEIYEILLGEPMPWLVLAVTCIVYIYRTITHLWYANNPIWSTLPYIYMYTYVNIYIYLCMYIHIICMYV